MGSGCRTNDAFAMNLKMASDSRPLPGYSTYSATKSALNCTYIDGWHNRLWGRSPSDRFQPKRRVTKVPTSSCSAYWRGSRSATMIR